MTSKKKKRENVKWKYMHNWCTVLFRDKNKLFKHWTCFHPHHKSLVACVFSIYFRGWTDSLYLRLRRRNRCNHRDLQNISQNGKLTYFTFFFFLIL